jgi:hypothetical protein
VRRRRVWLFGGAVRCGAVRGWLAVGPVGVREARVIQSPPEPDPELPQPAGYPRRPARSASFTSSAAFSPITIDGAFV